MAKETVEQRRKQVQSILEITPGIIADKCSKRLVEYDDPKEIRQLLREIKSSAEYILNHLIPSALSKIE